MSKLTYWLTKDEQKNVVTAHEKEVPGSQKAELNYKTLGKLNDQRIDFCPFHRSSSQMRYELGNPPADKEDDDAHLEQGQAVLDAGAGAQAVVVQKGKAKNGPAGDGGLKGYRHQGDSGDVQAPLRRRFTAAVARAFAPAAAAGIPPGHRPALQRSLRPGHGDSGRTREL